MSDLTEYEQEAIRDLRADKATWPGTTVTFHRLGTIPVQVQILNELADVPVAARAGDAGFDLRSMEAFWLDPGKRHLARTGLSVAIPEGFAGFVLPRSGLAVKGVTVANSPGLIDSGYRGEIIVILQNHGYVHRVERGDRIAQLVVLPVPAVEFQVVDALPDSERGSGGFGSSGS